MSKKSTIIFQIVFWIFHALIFWFGYYKQKNDDELSILNSLGYSIFISRACGLVLAFDCSVLLVGVCKKSLACLGRQSMVRRFIPIDSWIYFHRWTAYSMLLFSVIHINAHYTNFFLVEYQAPKTGLGTALSLHYSTFAGITGHVMLFCCFLMFTSAKREVKKHNFEVFWFTHHLFVPFYLALFFHASGCFVKSGAGKCKGYNSNWFTVPILIWYIADRLYRCYCRRLPVRLLYAIFHAGNTLELQFEKGSFVFSPGQYVYICIPKVSYLQWHPFTITSAPEDEFLSVHIRFAGDWTKAIANHIDISKQAEIFFDGPYGSSLENIYDFKVAIMIGAGIGVTPAASILRSIWYRFHYNQTTPFSKLYFFWINRNSEGFSWFQSLLTLLEDALSVSQFELHTYLTGGMSIERIRNIILNDQNSSDPVTKLKSPNNYLRPRWENILKSVRRENSFMALETDDDGYFETFKIGVFYCGPNSLATTLKKACLDNSDGCLEFVFQKELF